MSGLLGTPSQSPAGIRGFCSSGGPSRLLCSCVTIPVYSGRWNPAVSMGSPSLRMPRDSPSQSVAERCRQALQRSERSLSSRSAATPLKDSPSRQFHSPFRQTVHRSTSPFGNLQREVRTKYCQRAFIGSCTDLLGSLAWSVCLCLSNSLMSVSPLPSLQITDTET